jgi:hypothetical protein
MVDVLSMDIWLWNIKICRSHFKKEVVERGEYWRTETNQSTIYVYMEMSQWKPLYNHHILIRTFLKKQRQRKKRQRKQKQTKMSTNIIFRS